MNTNTNTNTSGFDYDETYHPSDFVMDYADFVAPFDDDDYYDARRDYRLMYEW